MANKSTLDCERDRIRSFKKYQLPYFAKKVGIIITIISFLLLFVNKFVFDSEVYRTILKYGMLIGLLIVSISKEKIEDELIIKLRMQSYTFAFVAGVCYALAMPTVEYFVDSAVAINEASFKDMGDFLILWMLLSVQVICFQILKRAHQ